MFVQQKRLYDPLGKNFKGRPKTYVIAVWQIGSIGRKFYAYRTKAEAEKGFQELKHSSNHYYDAALYSMQTDERAELTTDHQSKWIDPNGLTK